MTEQSKHILPTVLLKLFSTSTHNLQISTLKIFRSVGSQSKHYIQIVLRTSGEMEFLIFKSL